MRNGQKPKPRDLTYAKVEDAVDAYIHILIETLDETMGIKSCLALQLQDQTATNRRRILAAFDRRRDRYKSKAHRTDI